MFSKLSNSITLDFRSVSAFRITLGLMLIADILFYKMPYIGFCYTNNSVFTSAMILNITPEKWLSVMHIITTDIGVNLFFYFTLIVLIMFTIGFYTKWVSIIVFFCFVCITQRTSFTTGADMIFRSVLFWSMFLPLDRKFTMFKKKQFKFDSFQFKSPATFGILLQISLIYFLNAYTKSGNQWLDGTAVAYAAMNAAHMGTFADTVIFSSGLCKLLTYSTLLFEYLIILLVFSPFYNNITKITASVFIFSFHWGNLPFLEIGNFHLAALPLSIVLIPGNVWNIFNSKKQKNSSINSNEKYQTGKIGNVITWLAIIFMLIVNMETFTRKNEKVVPGKLRIKTGDYLGLFQRWQLFAPEPTKQNGYTIAIGKFTDNKMIDLYSGMLFDRKDVLKEPYKFNSMPYELYLPTVYMYNLRNYNIGKTIAERWSKYEVERWNNQNNGANLSQVLFMRINFNSISPGVISLVKFQKIYEFNCISGTANNH